MNCQQVRKPLKTAFSKITINVKTICDNQCFSFVIRFTSEIQVFLLLWVHLGSISSTNVIRSTWTSLPHKWVNTEVMWYASGISTVYSFEYPGCQTYLSSWSACPTVTFSQNNLNCIRPMHRNFSLFQYTNQGALHLALLCFSEKITYSVLCVCAVAVLRASAMLVFYTRICV